MFPGLDGAEIYKHENVNKQKGYETTDTIDHRKKGYAIICSLVFLTRDLYTFVFLFLEKPFYSHSVIVFEDFSPTFPMIYFSSMVMSEQRKIICLQHLRSRWCKSYNGSNYSSFFD